MNRLSMRSAPPLGFVLIIVVVVTILQFPASYIILNVSPILGILVNETAIILAIPMAIILIGGYSPVPLILMKRPGRRELLIAICVTLGTAVVLSYIKAAGHAIFPVPGFMIASHTKMVAVHSWHDFFLKLFLLGVLAPICEEIFFRGILQSSLTRRIGPWRAIVVTAVLFALIHSTSFYPHLLLTLGFLFSWLYYVTGTIRVPIICHVISNCWVLANQIRGIQIPISSPLGVEDFVLVGSAIVIVVAGIAWLHFKKRDRQIP
jgi:membrane protease YdiL (CAAX protease family)